MLEEYWTRDLAKMVPSKHQLDYIAYKTLLELGGSEVNQNLKVLRNKLGDKYGDRFAELLWDRFVREYGEK